MSSTAPRSMMSRRLMRDRRWSIGSIVIFALAMGAIAVPLISTLDAGNGSTDSFTDILGRRLVPPLGRDANGAFHLLGTDAFGRDMFVRLWEGARISIGVGVIGSLLSGLLGIALGAIAAWRGGIAERVIVALSDAMLSIPRLVLLLVIAALWGPGLTVVITVLALTGWMSVMRLVRTEVAGVRAQAYIESASALGVPGGRLLFRHILPNSLGAATVAVTLGVGNAILLESGLSFLGLGIQPPMASLGNMISGGREWLLTAPWIALTPGLLLIVTAVACTLLGDALTDANAVALSTQREEKAQHL